MTGWGVAFFREEGEKYQQVLDYEIRYDTYQVGDADLLLVAFGAMARMCLETVDLARAEGLKVGCFDQ